MVKLLGTVALVVALAACSPTGAEGVAWDEYGPDVQSRIDKAAEAGNCHALQGEFDAADSSDERHRAKFGTGNADLLDYIDAAMSNAGCY